MSFICISDYEKGLFNLAQLIEMGRKIPAKTWQKIGLSHLKRLPPSDQINGIYEMLLFSFIV